MPVYHFIFHAYRSWNAEHPRGYVQRGERGVMRPSPSLGYVRDKLARNMPVSFDCAEREFLVEAVKDAASQRKWQLYGVAVVEGHLHVVVGWQDSGIDYLFVQARIKRALGYLLAQRHGTKGRPYFSRGGSPERVRNRKHLRHLLDVYLPGHHGAHWTREGI